MTKKVIINTAHAPAAIGPYNQAIKADKTLYISGQIPLNPETMEIVQTGIVDEAQQVLQNLGAILASADYSFNDVVKATIFLSNMDDFAAVNEVYASYFVDNQPARECVAVKTLPRNVNVEISVIAWKA